MESSLNQLISDLSYSIDTLGMKDEHMEEFFPLCDEHQITPEYFAEEFTPEISTDKLHNRLLQFFDENRKKGNNAQGWKEFTEANINLPHAKDRKAAGISGKRYGKVKRSYSTGLHVQPIDPTIQKYLRIPIDRGVIVTDVEKNSSADKAGIRIRDVIYAVDNKYISSARDIKEIIKEGLNKSGDFISLSIYRGEDKINLQLQLEEPKDNWPGY